MYRLRSLSSEFNPCRAAAAAAILACCLLRGFEVSAVTCNQIESRPEEWVRANVDALVRTARGAYENDSNQKAYQHTIDTIVATIGRCRLDQDQSFVSRYREFIDYLSVVSLDRQRDHELGFKVPDKQYFAETRGYVEIPEFLLTPQFLRSVSRFEKLKEAKLLLQQLNAQRAPTDQLTFFSYESRHLGTPDNDNSFWRLLIVVPGNPMQRVPEKWVQFGIPDPRARAHVRNVSVVSAVPGANGTTNIYFKDYFRTYRRDGSITVKGRWELGEGDDNCVQCHKSGILPIFPVDGSVSINEAPAVQEVNQRFLSYSAPRFDRYLDATKFGPGLGSTNWPDLERRYGPDFDKSIVGKSMVCASCHQPNRLGSLNWPMDRKIISSFIKGGKMPLGHDLQTSERAELYRRLIQDYFAIDDGKPGVLKAWLLGRLRQRCESTI